ncbi:MAG: hypothetical protein KGM93_00385 [Sphingomonadales bacterium]|nr:hypothetical protein [Sphingomonadales bacterium]
MEIGQRLSVILLGAEFAPPVVSFATVADREAAQPGLPLRPLLRILDRMLLEDLDRDHPAVAGCQQLRVYFQRLESGGLNDRACLPKRGSC